MIDPSPVGACRLTEALRAPARADELALIPYLTAGFPSPDAFPALLNAIARAGDVLEIGLPFSDPIADGVTIQRASHASLRQGVTLRWLIGILRDRVSSASIPIVLMSYVNPLLVYGLDSLARDAAASRIDGFVVPDLPLEESGPLADQLENAGLALIQIVTPSTPRERLRRICLASRGFVYAVTMTGTTGGRLEPCNDLLAYLDEVKSVSTLPVVAGFGIRDPRQATMIRGHADGIVVGSAVVDLLEHGRDPLALLRSIREGCTAPGRRG